MKILLLLLSFILCGCNPSTYTKAKGTALANEVCETHSGVYEIVFQLMGQLDVRCLDGYAKQFQFTDVDRYTSQKIPELSKESK